MYTIPIAITFLVILVTFILLYIIYKYHSEKISLETGINNFIKDEVKLKQSLKLAEQENDRLNKEMNSIITKHNLLVDKANSLEQKAIDNGSVESVRSFYNQMFSDVLSEDPKVIDAFFAIVIHKDYVHLKHPEVSNNAFVPYEILKECITNSNKNTHDKINKQINENSNQ